MAQFPPVGGKKSTKRERKWRLPTGQLKWNVRIAYVRASVDDTVVVVVDTFCVMID